MICGKCGKENDLTDSNFCKNCGNQLSVVSDDEYLTEVDNAFLDMCNIDRNEDMFVKSCKICVIRKLMGNQIEDYKIALSTHWLTDEEWLKKRKNEKINDAKDTFLEVLLNGLGLILTGIEAVFHMAISLIRNIFSVVFSLIRVIIGLIVAIIVLSIVDYFVPFFKYIEPIENGVKTVGEFIANHYITGIIVICSILAIVAIVALKKKKSKEKQELSDRLAAYQIKRAQGMLKKEDAEKKLKKTELLYSIATNVLTDMNRCRESVPPEFWDNAEGLWYLYQSRRANNVQEAINLLEKLQYQSRMEEKMDRSLEMAYENRKSIEELQRISSDARDFAENAMAYAQNATNAAYTAASAARSAEWAAWSAKNEANSLKWEARSR